MSRTHSLSAKFSIAGVAALCVIGSSVGVAAKSAEKTRYDIRGGSDGATPNEGFFPVRTTLYGTTLAGDRRFQDDSHDCGTVFSWKP